MITIKVDDKKLLEQDTECLALMLEQDFAFSKELKALAKAVFPSLQNLMATRKFTGSPSNILVLPVALDTKITHLIFVGLGKRKDKKTINREQYRRALGCVIKEMIKLKCMSLAVHLPSPKLFGMTYEELAQETAIIAHMASYHFDDFITEPARKTDRDINVTIVVDSAYKKTAQKAVDQGNIIARSVNLARYWVDLPPRKLTPLDLAKKAKDLAKKYDLTCTIFDEKEVNQMGMGGLGAVSQGSDRSCQFVILEYITKKKGAPTIGFVGKGITFDSGGLSLKPPVHMETMKEDMAGAAAVIGAMQAIAQLKPKVNIIAITPLAENLPSGKATKPGDIVSFYNGKTAEVKNTDAEGRLILADALSYAVKHYKLDALIDIATLTGACAVALGPFFSGLMSQHEDVVERIYEAAEHSGERVWQLPIDDDYKAAIKSDVADMCNIGSRNYMAGTITAALFLQNFVEEVPWAHLDIAGTAFNVPDISYYRPGATGVGVRLLVALAMNWQ